MVCGVPLIFKVKCFEGTQIGKADVIGEWKEGTFECGVS